jgi:glutamyl-tRNA synthetase
MDSGVRVRIAPSPTGFLHLGTARTAIYNWLFARKHHGDFILRIEDTDFQRSSQAMVEGIIDGLKFLNVEPDEGPFFQSSFAEKHVAAARGLAEEGKAYYDFTPKEATDDRNVKDRIADRVKAEAETGKRQNPYRTLPLEEAKRRLASGESAAVRLKVPEEGVVRFDDMVYGPQERDHSEIEDIVLVRSDGHPLYNHSVVVDDIEMRISHVIRGQDHLTNTHKQVLIYQALGAPIPKFAHLPLILAPNKEKLSKRKHGEIVSITTYRDRGFLPDALFNFLALLGWSPGNDQEIMSRDELIEMFSLKAVNKAAAVFNFTEQGGRDWTDPKALWMNGEYIRGMRVQELIPMVVPFFERAGLWAEEFGTTRSQWFASAIDLLRARYRTLADFVELGRPYFSDDFSLDPAAVKKNLEKEGLADLLAGLADRLSTQSDFSHDVVESALRQYADEQGVKAGLLINASRTALTGQSVGPGIFEIFNILGRERSVERLRRAAHLPGLRAAQ